MNTHVPKGWVIAFRSDFIYLSPMRMGVVRKDRFAMCARADGSDYWPIQNIHSYPQSAPHPKLCIFYSQAVAATQHNTTHHAHTTHTYINAHTPTHNIHTHTCTYTHMHINTHITKKLKFFSMLMCRENLSRVLLNNTCTSKTSSVIEFLF